MDFKLSEVDLWKQVLDSWHCLDGQWTSEGIFMCVGIDVKNHAREIFWVVGIA